MTGVLKMPVSLACCPSINTELHGTQSTRNYTACGSAAAVQHPPLNCNEWPCCVVRTCSVWFQRPWWVCLEAECHSGKADMRQWKVRAPTCLDEILTPSNRAIYVRCAQSVAGDRIFSEPPRTRGVATAPRPAPFWGRCNALSERRAGALAQC